MEKNYYLNKYAKSLAKQKHKIKKTRKLVEKGREVKKQFGIDEMEIENIFEIQD